MTLANLVRGVAAALVMAATGTAALAQANGGDFYSRLLEMREMDRNKDGMVSKQEFLAMVGKIWDMHSIEIKVKGSKMTPEQVKEIEKILGRTLSDHGGR